jgi:hypothetical protein
VTCKPYLLAAIQLVYALHVQGVILDVYMYTVNYLSLYMYTPFLRVCIFPDVVTTFQKYNLNTKSHIINVTVYVTTVYALNKQLLVVRVRYNLLHVNTCTL